MNLPRVTAVVPNYNHARLVPRCLDALLNQPLPPDEIIVIDDASTDDSADVLASYARKSARIRFIRNERNSGVHATLNRGLELAQHTHVGFFAADDEVLPGLFQKSLPMLARYPEAGFVSGICRWQCHSTGVSWLYGATMPAEPCFLAPPDMVRLARAGHLQVPAQPAIYRKDALQKAGGWRPELRWFTDWFGTWAVGFRHGICHVPEELSIFHLYPTSYYHTQKALRLQTMECLLQLLESREFSDINPWIRDSGLLGSFGMPAFRLAMSKRSHRQFLTIPFLRLFARRQAEIVGRRFFPDWLTRTCLRLFYGGK